VIVSVGARVLSITDDWGGYVPDEASARHRASVAEPSSDAETAYDEIGHRETVRYDGWLPG
jgi:hypothetical protein